MDEGVIKFESLQKKRKLFDETLHFLRRYL